MPVEIREIVVKTQIEGKSDAKTSMVTQEQLDNLKQEIVEECIDQIMATIRKKQER